MLLVAALTFTASFGTRLTHIRRPKIRFPTAHGTLGAKEDASSTEDVREALIARGEREGLKLQLLRVCAACNRGFGASMADRTNVDVLLAQLNQLNPTLDSTVGVTGSDAAAPAWRGRGLENSAESDGTIASGPLEGVWRLVYTNASDVLSLDVNPIAGVGPISQEISLPGSVTNVIDFYPRAASLLPPGLLRSSTRLRVMTRATARSMTRVGLTFERVAVEPRALLGADISSLLPALSIPLPRLPGSDRAGADSASSPAFFDVTYLDRELLVIQQNEPGGVFVAVRETQDELRLRSDPQRAAVFG